MSLSHFSMFVFVRPLKKIYFRVNQNWSYAGIEPTTLRLRSTHSTNSAIWLCHFIRGPMLFFPSPSPLYRSQAWHSLIWYITTPLSPKVNCTHREVTTASSCMGAKYQKSRVILLIPSGHTDDKHEWICLVNRFSFFQAFDAWVVTAWVFRWRYRVQARARESRQLGRVSRLDGQLPLEDHWSGQSSKLECFITK